MFKLRLTREGKLLPYENVIILNPQGFKFVFKRDQTEDLWRYDENYHYDVFKYRDGKVETARFTTMTARRISELLESTNFKIIGHYNENEDV